MFVNFLCSQPLMKVVKGLIYNSRPRHIRDLASSYSLSPAGVSDIIRRLNKEGLLTEMSKGNKRCFTLNLTPSEIKCLKNFYLIQEADFIKKRSARFNINAEEKLKWMDEAYEFYREFKKVKKNTVRGRSNDDST